MTKESKAGPPKQTRKRKQSIKQLANSQFLVQRAAGPEQNRWLEFEESLSAEVGRRRLLPNLSPYDKAHSFLKREIYRYVCDCLDRKLKRELERCIEASREGTLPRTPKFNDNPFHWALLGLQRADGIGIGNGAVSRYGRQLLYASYHNVPPHLLVGFLYQTGNPEQISKKVKDNEREEWFSEAKSLQPRHI